MENNSKAPKVFSILIMIIIFAVIIIPAIFEQGGNITQVDKVATASKQSASSIRIISSQENQPLEAIVQNYAKTKGYSVTFDYAGTLDIIQDLNENSANYDAMWISNSIWSYMVDSGVTISNSKCTSINPVIFGVKKSKAAELGFVGKTVYTKDIVDAISSGNLKFSMPNPTSTNAGASAYLGMLATLAGNPEVLTEEHLQNEQLKTDLRTLFTGLERSSGSEDFLEELFLNGDYEAVVTYESSIININKQLTAKGQEPLFAIYPVDGVSISDSPFAYIDNKSDAKKAIFEDIQRYILSDEGQKLLQQQGKRTWYGGVSSTADNTIFNPDWGIDTTQYISPIKYPSTAVIKSALNLYQTQLRKPIHIVFCLDYSGSMYGEGIYELKNAMKYILTDEAANDFIQFSNEDKIDIIPFNSTVGIKWSTNNGEDTSALLKNINSYSPNGTTAIYPAAVKALEILVNEDINKYNVSVVLMTDGINNVGRYSDLQEYYSRMKNKIPVYSIMFGEADRSELDNIAKLTNGKVFDGKQNLVKAFKEVRGYN